MSKRRLVYTNNMDRENRKNIWTEFNISIYTGWQEFPTVASVRGLD